jgi:GT2 family glycosyltransferase
LRAETVEWILQTYTEMAPGVEVHIVNTPLPLPHARNMQVHRFLKSSCTHLFTLDSDCIPKPGTIQKLLARDLPVVVAPHATVVGEEVGVMALDRVPDGYRQHRPMSGFQKCDAVGGSGILVRREVLEELGPPWFMFEYDQNGLLSKGEDFYFSDRLKAAGYEIWVDFALTQRHRVGVVV